MKGQLHNELDEANPVACGVERFPLTKRLAPMRARSSAIRTIRRNGVTTSM